MERMPFTIWGSESTRGFDATGSCEYFDAEQEMSAIKKEWKRNEVVSLYAAVQESTKIPEEHKRYLEEKQEHSGTLILNKMVFNGPCSIFDEENVGMKYNISVGTFTFTQCLLVSTHIYSDNEVDYVDVEFAISYVTWRGENNLQSIAEKA